MACREHTGRSGVRSAHRPSPPGHLGTLGVESGGRGSDLTAGEIIDLCVECRGRDRARDQGESQHDPVHHPRRERPARHHLRRRPRARAPGPLAARAAGQHARAWAEGLARAGEARVQGRTLWLSARRRGRRLVRSLALRRSRLSDRPAPRSGRHSAQPAAQRARHLRRFSRGHLREEGAPRGHADQPCLRRDQLPEHLSALRGPGIRGAQGQGTSRSRACGSTTIG